MDLDERISIWDSMRAEYLRLRDEENVEDQEIAKQRAKLQCTRDFLADLNSSLKDRDKFWQDPGQYLRDHERYMEGQEEHLKERDKFLERVNKHIEALETLVDLGSAIAHDHKILTSLVKVYGT